MFRLALALGGMTVDELGRRMTSRELAEWRVFATLEPIGEARADHRAGIIASTIANVNRAKKSKAFKPTDFMPFMEKMATDTKAQAANVMGDIKSFFRKYEKNPRGEDGGTPDREKPRGEDGGTPDREKPKGEDGGTPD